MDEMNGAFEEKKRRKGGKRLTQPETVAYEPVGDGVVRHERKPDVPAGAGRAQHGDAGAELGAQGERRAAGGLPVGLKQ